MRLAGRPWLLTRESYGWRRQFLSTNARVDVTLCHDVVTACRRPTSFRGNNGGARLTQAPGLLHHYNVQERNKSSRPSPPAWVLSLPQGGNLMEYLINDLLGQVLGQGGAFTIWHRAPWSPVS